ncbi:hypothetical protein JR316_0009780 [Psilocybe cubensis]|uniref:Uncharacterized protein n=1 Tax=Psilocybe cubensis TaxID=181762 RepID=A0ACB8GPA5_PSICU|nr:hypothetical protein JR316_0009780 [Psilocybe cubensis]KAH9477558.1 hypothetical protein JR316_0009780 [Psilocybe cubensis]
MESVSQFRFRLSCPLAVNIFNPYRGFEALYSSEFKAALTLRRVHMEFKSVNTLGSPFELVHKRQDDDEL